MHAGVIACAAVWALAAPVYAQDSAAFPAQPPSIVREIRLVGAKELSRTEAIDAAGVRVGEPLPSVSRSLPTESRSDIARTGTPSRG